MPVLRVTLCVAKAQEGINCEKQQDLFTSKTHFLLPALLLRLVTRLLFHLVEWPSSLSLPPSDYPTALKVAKHRDSDHLIRGDTVNVFQRSLINGSGRAVREGKGMDGGMGE